MFREVLNSCSVSSSSESTDYACRHHTCAGHRSSRQVRTPSSSSPQALTGRFPSDRRRTRSCSGGAVPYRRNTGG
eukprot:3642144-Prymnesium_polylepis.1